jgi:hypothetical protein
LQSEISLENKDYMKCGLAKAGCDERLTIVVRTNALYPPRRHRGYNRGMSEPDYRIFAIVELALGVAVAAFCIWLFVRVINRQERWAICTLIALAGVLVYGWLSQQVKQPPPAPVPVNTSTPLRQP